MRIYLSATPRDLKNAKDWLTDNRLLTAVSTLEQTLAAKQQEWGQASVFIECSLPASGRTRPEQIDLLVAFQDRAALCELKQERDIKLESWAGKIQAKKNLLERHLINYGLDARAAHVFLWTPNVPHARLAPLVAAYGENEHWQNVIPLGMHELSRAILDRLSEKLPRTAPATGVDRAILDIFRRYAAQPDRRLFEFPSFEAARSYLRGALPRWNAELVPDPSHVMGLRGTSLREALEGLRKSRAIEVSGPQGVGKTTFIKELLIEFLRPQMQSFDVTSSILVRQSNEVLVLRSLASEAGLIAEERIRRMSKEALFEELLNTDLVYWIRDYDDASHAGIVQLAHHLQEAAVHGRSYWIIESTTSHTSPHTGSLPNVRLEPLSSGDLAAILHRHPRGAVEIDLNSVISASAGIPRLAVWWWTSPDATQPPKAERLDQYDLFMRRLLPGERRLVVAIAYILSQSPLGATIRLVEVWCRTVLQLPGSEARLLARGVIAKSFQARLIAIELFGSENAEPLALDQAGGPARLLQLFMPGSIEQAQAGWIRTLDPHFVSHFASALPQEERQDWRQRLESVLLEGLEDDLSLTGVTLDLLGGSFDALVRSSFRQSAAALPRVSEWLAATDDPLRLDGGGSNVHYFRRWLEWMLDHYWDETHEGHQAGAPDRLGPPNPEEPLQIFLFETIQTRGHSHWDGHGYDWEAWSAKADELRHAGEIDLWAETLLRQAQAWLRPPYNKPSQTWSLMKTVLNAAGELSAQAGRSMLCFHVLSFLNKRKTWEEHVPEIGSEAAGLVRRLAGQMIEDGMAMENANTVANALFFLARFVELERQPRSRAEVDAYITMLRFVERVSPARRIQALLTQGSVYRHYCRQDDIEWVDFRAAASDAIELYERTFESADRAGMTTHAMNALIYRGGLLLKALRFAGEAEMKPWLRTQVSAPRDRSEAFLERVRRRAAPDAGTLDQHLVLNLCKSSAVDRWLNELLNPPPQHEELCDSFDEMVRRLDTTARTFSRDKRTKEYQVTLKDVRRVLEFTGSEATQQQALRSCAQPLLDLLKHSILSLPTTPRFRKSSDIYKEGRRITKILADAQVEIPRDLREAFP